MKWQRHCGESSAAWRGCSASHYIGEGIGRPPERGPTGRREHLDCVHGQFHEALCRAHPLREHPFALAGRRMGDSTRRGHWPLRYQGNLICSFRSCGFPAAMIRFHPGTAGSPCARSYSARSVWRSMRGAQNILPGTRAGPSLATRLKDNTRRLMHAYEATAAAAALD